jgi:nicotinate phosphoribosyltransferase
MNTPMIISRLDNDYYNFTMGQLIWRFFPDVEVTYELTNRTSAVQLGELIATERLMAEIEQLRALQWSNDEINFLRRQGIFREEYLQFLQNDCQLPPVEVGIRNGELIVRYRGNWAEAVFWETPLLAIINQLANESRAQGHEAHILTQADRRTDAKLQRWSRHPRVRGVEFGTRRRYNLAHQEHVIRQMMSELGDRQLLGTSNVYLAYKYGLAPKGTMAHQLFMVTAALAEAAGSARPIADSQRWILDEFEMLYGKAEGNLLVFLPDTFGTTTALSLLEPGRAAKWAGMRQDSGDPAEQIEQLIAYYRACGIDPKSKSIMASDGLDVATMIELDDRFGDQTNLVFGIGTNMTNDTPIPPLSIVIKPVLANGHPCVKLSDNLAKATGDAATIARRKLEAGYHASYRLAPTV